jgi:hypothetical protein
VHGHGRRRPTGRPGLDRPGGAVDGRARGPHRRGGASPPGLGRRQPEADQLISSTPAAWRRASSW